MRELQCMALAMLLSSPAIAQPALARIKTEFQAVSIQVEKHLVEGQWIDDDPESPALLTRQWALAGEWVAAWLDAHPVNGAADVEMALAALAPSEDPRCIALNRTTFLMSAPGPIGNALIVAKSGDRYRVAWNIARSQQAAWRAENAKQSSHGSLAPDFGRLPPDANGMPRFYVDGTYAQIAGATIAAQISLWVWDGFTARPAITHEYGYMLAQKVRTRMEGDILKVQQKKSFRTFYSCGQCEERQMDWMVRVTPERLEELGEKSLVPELDLVDELFARLMHNRNAAAIASAAALQAARSILAQARSELSAKEWKEYPTLGMLMGSRIDTGEQGKTVCLSVLMGGENLFALRPVGGSYFIDDIRKAKESCSN